MLRPPCVYLTRVYLTHIVSLECPHSSQVGFLVITIFHFPLLSLLLHIPPLLPLAWVLMFEMCPRPSVCYSAHTTTLNNFGSMQICHKFCCHLMKIRLKIHLFFFLVLQDNIEMSLLFLYVMFDSSICFYSLPMWIYLRVGDMAQLVKHEDQSSDTQHPHRS